MTKLVGTVDLLAASLRLFDLGGIEQRCDNRGRSDSDGDAGLYQFRPSLIVAVAHSILLLNYGVRSYSERGELESGGALCVVA